jgi:hypothetical protein
MRTREGRFAGDTVTGNAVLRDLVNATIGFEGLAAEVNKPSKSLNRMLASHGNPNIENFFSIVSALQKKTRVKLSVTATTLRPKSAAAPSKRVKTPKSRFATLLGRAKGPRTDDLMRLLRGYDEDAQDPGFAN